MLFPFFFGGGGSGGRDTLEKDRPKEWGSRKQPTSPTPQNSLCVPPLSPSRNPSNALKAEKPAKPEKEVPRESASISSGAALCFAGLACLIRWLGGF